MGYTERLHVHPDFKRAVEQKSKELGLSMVQTTKMMGKSILDGSEIFTVEGRKQKRIRVDTSFRFFK